MKVILNATKETEVKKCLPPKKLWILVILVFILLTKFCYVAQRSWSSFWRSICSCRICH